MKTKNEQVFVFCDFDGTITRKDSGDEFFKTFSKFEPAHSKLMNGDYNVQEYYKRVVSNIQHHLDKEDISAFANHCDVDAYFSQFLNLVLANDWHIYIVSDGFDIYINEILSRVTQAETIQVFSNSLKSQKDSNQPYTPVFPFADENCNCFCASCKRKVLLGNAPGDALIVYVGDGRSDTCPVHYADMVFAKGTLAAYCNKHGIMHHSWNSFFDIISVLKKRKPVARDIARKERQKAYKSE